MEKYENEAIKIQDIHISLTLLPSFVMSSLSIASILDSSSLLSGMGRMKPGHLDAASLMELNKLRETASLPVMRMNF